MGMFDHIDARQINEPGQPPATMTARARTGPLHLAPLDYVFRVLAILSVIEIGALASNIATYPNAAGLIGQGLLPRVILGLFAGPSMILFSALLLWRAPGNGVGRFLLLLGTVEVGAQFVFDFGSPVATVVFVLFILYAAGIGIPSVGYLLLHFPTGAPYPPRWARGMIFAAVLKFVGAALEIMASSNRVGIFTLPINPLFVPLLAPYQPLIAVTIGLGGILLPLIGLLGISSLVLRYRAGETRVRKQIKWVIWAPSISFIGALLVFMWVIIGGAPSLLVIPATFFALAQLTLLASLTIAILRYHLFDIDRLLNRTFVYGALTIVVIGAYVLIVGSLSMLFETSGNLSISLLATGLIALLFQPVRERLQRSVNRLMYGERDEPYAALSRLGQRLEATLTPDTILPAIVETVAQALKLPYAAIQLTIDNREPKIEAVFPSAMVQLPPDLVRLPLIYQTETIGHLLLAARAPGESFTLADLRLLEQFAHQASVAAHAVQLTRELQRSRERLVTAREEERRRIRRDLHDGLGPTLAAQTLKIGSARALFGQNPAAADQLLSELEGDIQAALADIRRLVYDLRPPALDELGLVAAIRSVAAQFSATYLGNRPGRADQELDIGVDAPDPLPPLPAAVEVAAFRIVQEALTNVVRHSQAHTCVVRLRVEDKLRVEISDDGHGLSEAQRSGIGLTSMRERAAELGGTCTIAPQPGGGTRLRVELPLVNEV